MVHHQHVGPIGQYHVPERSRFRWDTERFKMASIAPGIEVLEEGGGGREEMHYNAKLKIEGNVYSIRTVSEPEFDESGNQVFNYRNGDKKPSNQVWIDVHVFEILERDGRPSFSRVYIDSDTEQLAQIIFDFLSVNRSVHSDLNKVVRIIFSDKNSISPKNYAVSRG